MLTGIYAEHCRREDESVEDARARFSELIRCALSLHKLTTAATALERDYFMTAQEAQAFGIVDRIVERRAKDEADEDEDKADKAEKTEKE